MSTTRETAEDHLEMMTDIGMIEDHLEVTTDVIEMITMIMETDLQGDLKDPADHTVHQQVDQEAMIQEVQHPEALHLFIGCSLFTDGACDLFLVHVNLTNLGNVNLEEYVVCYNN